MKIAKLKKAIENVDDNLEIVVFTAGTAYPVLCVKCSENYPEIENQVFEIGCGWTPIEDTE